MVQMPRSLNSAPMPYPDEQRMTLRLPRELREDLEACRKADHRSLNAEIVWLLVTAVEIHKALHKANDRLEHLGPEGDGTPDRV